MVFGAEAFPTPVDYSLPYPGLIPDHPLYPLKRLRDWLLIVFTRDPVKKIELHILLADKKLVMGELLYDKRKTKLSVETFYEGEIEQSNAVAVLSVYKTSDNPPVGLTDKLELSVKKHKEVMLGISAGVTDIELQKKLQQALSMNNRAYSQIQSLKD